MKLHIPPILLIGIDSETDRDPRVPESLSWSSSEYTTLEIASTIGLVIDPYNVYPVEEIKMDGVESVFTNRFLERVENTPWIKPVFARVYSSKDEDINSPFFTEGFEEMAVENLRSRLRIRNPPEELVKIETTRLMKERITEDIHNLAYNFKYSMLLAHNLGFDWNTMIDTKTFEKHGWELSFFKKTNLSAGDYFMEPNEISPENQFGEFLGTGSYGLMFRKSTNHLKTMFLADTFWAMTYALVKIGHFIRLPKYHPDALDSKSYNSKNARMRIIKYNIRDVEVMLDALLQHPEAVFYMITAITTFLYTDKVISVLTDDINKEIWQARYLQNKRYVAEYDRRIIEREKDYSDTKYFEDVFGSLSY